MKRILLVISCGIFVFNMNAQVYTDYIGAGHDLDIIVTSSTANTATDAANTVSGSGMDADLMEASRFMYQATLGVDRAEVMAVADYPGGYAAWIDDQILLPASSMEASVTTAWNEALQARIDGGADPDDVFGPYALHFHYGWWQNAMTNSDHLRHKIAYAMSQILVVSMQSDLRDRGVEVGHFYDIFVDNAFGNYKDMLSEVSLHVAMGYYLSHLNNPRTDLSNNIHPDENYAREILQLFSIGLYKLNNDGSRQLDTNGNPIPTYNNAEIKELAKVFTGLGAGALNANVTWTTTPYFGLDIWGIDMTVPMQMYETWHEQGPKTIIDGYTIPAGQTGMEDVQDAIDHIFEHPNVGPFVARRLIQRLVKSNPTPAYIARVADAFNDNGQGVRGDMSAVTKAILLDEEARDCSYLEDPTNGRLREPLMRYTHLATALPTDSPLGRYWNNGYGFLDAAKQMVLQSPSVFNFYLPDHQPVGNIASNGLVAPEFKLHNTASSIGMMNEVNAWAVWDNLMYSWEGDYGDVPVTLATEDIEATADEVEDIINEYDILFTHGQLTDQTRNTLRDALNPLVWGDYQFDRTRLGLYLLLISPDYAIIK